MDKTEPTQTLTRREEKARQKEIERRQDQSERMVADQFYHSVANMMSELIRLLEAAKLGDEVNDEDIPIKKQEAVLSFLSTLRLLTPRSRYLQSQDYTIQQALLLAYPSEDEYQDTVQLLAGYGYQTLPLPERKSARERTTAVFSAIGSAAAKSFAFTRQK